jgi:hypothetical protein
VALATEIPVAVAGRVAAPSCWPVFVESAARVAVTVRDALAWCTAAALDVEVAVAVRDAVADTVRVAAAASAVAAASAAADGTVRDPVEDRAAVAASEPPASWSACTPSAAVFVLAVTASEAEPETVRVVSAAWVTVTVNEDEAGTLRAPEVSRDVETARLATMSCTAAASAARVAVTVSAELASTDLKTTA